MINITKPLNKTNPEFTLIWSEYNDDISNYGKWSKKSVKWKCPFKVHEDYYREIFKQVKSGLKCPKCPTMPEPGEDLLSKFELVCEEFSLKNPYGPDNIHAFSNKKVLWDCSQCGNEYSMSPLNKVNGSGCPVCANKRIVIGLNDAGTASPELVKLWSSKNNTNIGQYAPYSTYKALWECDYGHEWSAPISRLSSGHRCPYCSGNLPIVGSNDIASSDFISLWSTKNVVEPSEVKVGSSRKVWWTCPNGHPDYMQSPSDKISQGKGCRRCVRTVSRQELEIRNFLQSFNLDIEVSKKGILDRNRELDIYIPSKKIAIEFNGLYWHSEPLYSNRNGHYDKWRECYELGIQLITIWEDDWRNKRDIVKSSLVNKLGLYNGKKIFARNTYVSIITKDEASSFLNSHHIQGRAHGKYYLGLRDKESDELVSSMVLKESSGDLILERYASSMLVVGGQSKLLAYVDKTINYTKMTTFADLSISDGNLYQATGWTKDSLLKPDYKYVFNGNRVHKFNFRKNKFQTNPKLQYVDGATEKELAELNGLRRIWDCGKIRYVRYKK